MDHSRLSAAESARRGCHQAVQHRSCDKGGLVTAVWEDVVTVGLIGTDRRPVPDQLPSSWGTERNHGMDPAHAVLSLAARHRALTRAGGRLASCPSAPFGPTDRQPVAGRAAHEILDRLLSPLQVELLNLWMVAAV